MQEPLTVHARQTFKSSKISTSTNTSVSGTMYIETSTLPMSSEDVSKLAILSSKMENYRFLTLRLAMQPWTLLVQQTPVLVLAPSAASISVPLHLMQTTAFSTLTTKAMRLFTHAMSSWSLTISGYSADKDSPNNCTSTVHFQLFTKDCQIMNSATSWEPTKEAIASITETLFYLFFFSDLL